jgi:O-antigen ligase
LCHKIAAALIGLSTPFQLQWFGIVYASEILLAMVALWALVTHLADGHFWRRPIMTFLGFLGVTMLAYIVTDLTLGTESQNLLRGWARNLFLGGNLIGLYFLCRRNSANILIYAIASGAGMLAFFCIGGQWLEDWKFGASAPVTLLAAGLVPLVPRRGVWLGSLALALAGLLHLALDSREIGGNCLLAGVLLLARCSSRLRLRTLSRAMLGALALTGVCAFLYVDVLTGEEYGQRRHLSNAWRTASLLTAASAISDSPWMGSGSQANSFELQSRYDSIFAERAGVRYRGQQTDTSTFSPHSQILQAWFEAGIFGAAFFLYLGWKLIRAAHWCIFTRRLDVFSVLFAFCLLRAIWHLAFSPFAGLARLDVALAVVIVVVLDLERRSRRGIFAA